MKIYKYPLELTDVQEVHIPAAAPGTLLSVINQHGTLCLYAAVEPEDEPVACRIYVHGTGHDIISPGANFIGTVEFGPLVFHVFVEPL